MITYKITINGKNRFYNSLKTATKAAERVFNKTGIIVGIVPVKPVLGNVYKLSDYRAKA